MIIQRPNRKYYAIYEAVPTLKYAGVPKKGKPRQVALPITIKTNLKTREEVQDACRKYWAPFLKKGKKPPIFKNSAFHFVGYRYGLDGDVIPKDGELTELITQEKN